MVRFRSLLDRATHQIAPDIVFKQHNHLFAAVRLLLSDKLRMQFLSTGEAAATRMSYVVRFTSIYL